MSDLLVVANRGPVSAAVGPDGTLAVSHAAGGLAPSLARALAGKGATWIAAPSSTAEREAAARGLLARAAGDVDLRFVELDEAVQRAAYRVIANETLWFVHHAMFDRIRRPVFDRSWYAAWEGYRAYNRAFADEIRARASRGATVVVNDYHLTLLGSMLASERPDLATVHFSHTPFASPEELAVLPDAVATELLAGLCSFGACGFHTSRWADAFCACASAYGIGAPDVFVAPLGTDARELAGLAATPEASARRDALLARLEGRRLVLRSDRVEPSKNLVRGFLAFEELLERAPRWRDRVLFVARAYPSRSDIPEYRAYRDELEAVVARVNARFASGSGGPIELEVADDFAASLAALSCYDVLLVNPIRDGMNLVAKEGPAVNRRDGVLVLSREAGAFAELGGDAIAVEPFDVSGTAAALARALEMAPEERAARAHALAALAGAHPPASWFAELLARARCPVPDRALG